MSVTITGNDVHDVRRQLCIEEPRLMFKVFRRRPDYGTNHEHSSRGGKQREGCVVEVDGEEAPRVFESAQDAFKFILTLLEAHDETVRAYNKGGPF